MQLGQESPLVNKKGLKIQNLYLAFMNEMYLVVQDLPIKISPPLSH
jgi:hypothetical protein